MTGANETYRPGWHSHNARRRNEVEPKPKGQPGISVLRFIFLIIGLGCLGYYAYSILDQQIYQTYENWAFDQQIAGHKAVTFGDFLRFKLGLSEAASSENTTNQASRTAPREIPATGAVIGRVSVDRLNLSAVVRQGVDNDVLRTAVGHVPSTALAGENGNFAIAAHRDSLFRGLKDIQKGDLVRFESRTGTYEYEVEATRIVKPSDVSVLRPDGGGLIQPSAGNSPEKLLTMITCYPFYYVGAAPKRFVVEAKLVNPTNQARLSRAN